MALRAYIGQIVHTRSLCDFEAIPRGFVAVSDGKIVAVGSDYETWKSSQKLNIQEIRLTPTQFLMPGFIDCHIHAPQMPNIGLGLDKPLLDWLEYYTFPTESQFSDAYYAQTVYEKVIRTTLQCGTTLASYHATIHKDSCIILAKEAIKQGQRAFIGKVCMNCNCPSYYIESTDESLSSTREFIKEITKLESDIVRPSVTPRFAISCTPELMKGLAVIARDNALNIQTHISENLEEIRMVRENSGKLYAQVYEEANLLSNKTIMAHCVHLEDEEINIFKKTGTSIAHCPSSNTNLASGLCDVRRFLEVGINVGLGTDVSGGNNASIHKELLRCLEVSRHLSFIKSQCIKGCDEKISKNINYKPLNYQEAFYLATLGGAEALAVDNIVGNFIEGKDFDALVIEADAFPIEHLKERGVCRPLLDELLELVQKFIYTGDDRNVLQVYVKGREVKQSAIKSSNQYFSTMFSPASPTRSSFSSSPQLPIPNISPKYLQYYYSFQTMLKAKPQKQQRPHGDSEKSIGTAEVVKKQKVSETRQKVLASGPGNAENKVPENHQVQAEGETAPACPP